MDITGWSIEQRMRLPDWCFGNRELTGAYVSRNPTGLVWAIGTLVLPDPACIWTVYITSMPNAGMMSYVRVGLADTVPTSEAEMNAAVEILPHGWQARAGPNRISLLSGAYALLVYDVRRGMATGGKKLVIEMDNIFYGWNRVEADLIVSGLPTDMAGWLAHSPV